jgi:hypothetical protein
MDSGYTSVQDEVLNALLDHVLQRATQNHKMHESWNEGSGDFKDCSRGDCTESRALLEPWGWL